MNSELEKLELSESLVRLVDGSITPEQFAKLDRLLSEDHQALEYYGQFMSIYARLQKPGDAFATSVESRLSYDSPIDEILWAQLAEYERIAETVEVEKPSEEPEGPPVIKPARPERKMSKLSVFTLVSSAAAILLLFLLVRFIPTRPPLVASLGYTVDAVWGQSTEEMLTGEDFEANTYYLEKGLVQILFYNGAKVILEGPANFELSSTSAMKLLSGKVVANVNRDAVGFTVKTPSTKVLDLGTEFGIEVDLSGDSDIHVFDGEVILYPENDGRKMPLLKGKAKSVSTSGEEKDIEINRFAFIRQDEFNSNVKARQGDSYSRWLAYSYQLRRDPDLVAYYTFEKDDQNPNKLKNLAAATDGKCDGILLGNAGTQLPTWAQGRWPNKTALKFDRSHMQLVEISSDPKLNIAGPITISAWINCTNLRGFGSGIIVSSRTHGNINYQLSYGLSSELVRKPVIGFGRYTKYGNPITESHKLSLMPDIWHHVVVSHNNQEVRYYIDGSLYSVRPLISQHGSVEAKLLLGAAKKQTSGLSDRTFNGIMGEMAIFKRVLSGEEIATMYKAAKP